MFDKGAKPGAIELSDDPRDAAPSYVAPGGKRRPAGTLPPRTELGAVRYDYNVLGSKGPRVMTGAIPRVDAGSGARAIFRSDKAGKGGILEALKEETYAGCGGLDCPEKQTASMERADAGVLLKFRRSRDGRVGEELSVGGYARARTRRDARRRILAIRQSRQGRVHDGLRVPDVRAAGVRDLPQQLRQQARVRVRGRMRGGGRPGFVAFARTMDYGDTVRSLRTRFRRSRQKITRSTTLPFAEVGALGAPATVTPARGPPGGPHARVRAASSPARPGASARRDCRGCRPLDGYARHLPRSISEIISRSAPTRPISRPPSVRD